MMLLIPLLIQSAFSNIIPRRKLSIEQLQAIHQAAVNASQQAAITNLVFSLTAPVGPSAQNFPIDEAGKDLFDLSKWNHVDYGWAKINRFAQQKTGTYKYCPVCPGLTRPSELKQLGGYLYIPQVGHRTCWDLFFEGRLKNYNSNMCGLTMDAAMQCCPDSMPSGQAYTPPSESATPSYDNCKIPQNARQYFDFTLWTEADYKLTKDNDAAGEPVGTGVVCNVCENITRPSEMKVGFFYYQRSSCLDLFYEGRKKVFTAGQCQRDKAAWENVCCFA